MVFPYDSTNHHSHSSLGRARQTSSISDSLEWEKRRRWRRRVPEAKALQTKGPMSSPLEMVEELVELISTESLLSASTAGVRETNETLCGDVAKDLLEESVKDARSVTQVMVLEYDPHPNIFLIDEPETVHRTPLFIIELSKKDIIMSSCIDAVPEQLCYIPCNFCNIVLAVSVPCSSLLDIVTVRCGHCTNLWSVNMAAAFQSLSWQGVQAQHNHNAQNYRIESGSSSKGNKKIATRDSIADHRATEERVNRHYQKMSLGRRNKKNRATIFFFVA
ncbi:hypothetical protein ACLB2K_000288 [Fragaria x ananassa]